MGFKSLWRSITNIGHHQAPMQPLPAGGREEPLECVSKEHQRDEHLKNLGMKRNKSIRRSIAKRLRRKEKLKEEDDRDNSPERPIDSEPHLPSNKENHAPQQPQQPPSSHVPNASAQQQPSSTASTVQQQLPVNFITKSAATTHRVDGRRQEKQKRLSSGDVTALATGAGGGKVLVETRTNIGSQIPGGRKVEVIQVEQPQRDGNAILVGEPQPLPAHVLADNPRKMDKLRRSIRHSMKKRRELGLSEQMSKQEKWKVDEASVRAANCNFYVKYLGSCEVFESRGMQVCEAAVRSLKEQRRRTVRGTLHISGDSIRLVDDDTKGLVIDQTIEKVSFCAPDRNFDRGFSYICRDGTTRRWMCHAFMAIGDTGDRLSHAVGCAFGICLENKQKRDQVAHSNVSVAYDAKDASFTRNGSFAVRTMTEQQQQRLFPAGNSVNSSSSRPSISSLDAVRISRSNESPKSMRSMTSSGSEASSAPSGSGSIAVERPRPPEQMYQRQASFRGLGQLAGGATPFKRGSRGQLSLRPNDLPSNKERRSMDRSVLHDLPILEDIELPPSNLDDNQHRNECVEGRHSSGVQDLLSGDDPFSSLSDSCSGSFGIVNLATRSQGTASSRSSTPALGMTEATSDYGPLSLEVRGGGLSGSASMLQPVKLHSSESMAEKVAPNGSSPWDQDLMARSQTDQAIAAITTAVANTHLMTASQSVHFPLSATSGSNGHWGNSLSSTAHNSINSFSSTAAMSTRTDTSISDAKDIKSPSDLASSISYNIDKISSKSSFSHPRQSTNGTTFSGQSNSRNEGQDQDHQLFSIDLINANNKNQMMNGSTVVGGARAGQNGATSSGFNSPASSNSGASINSNTVNNNTSVGSGSGAEGEAHATQEWHNSVRGSILEDPFDADWAAIATRNSTLLSDSTTKVDIINGNVDAGSCAGINLNPSTNPFLDEIPSSQAQIKTFELQL